MSELVSRIGNTQIIQTEDRIILEVDGDRQKEMVKRINDLPSNMIDPRHSISLNGVTELPRGTKVICPSKVNGNG